MEQTTGYCGKCGAPYTQESPWWGIMAPTVNPSCACWNTPKMVTVTDFTYTDPIYNRENNSGY